MSCFWSLSDKFCPLCRQDIRGGYILSNPVTSNSPGRTYAKALKNKATTSRALGIPGPTPAQIPARNPVRTYSSVVTLGRGH